MPVPFEADQGLSIIQENLAGSLIAVYLHGSSVVGGLQAHSDVDLLVVIDQPMPSGLRKGLAGQLMNISGRYPFDPEGRRPLEVIVFLRADLLTPHYPARSECIYGEWLRKRYEAGETPEPASDPEFTLVLAQARQEAKSLFGPAASALLPVISQADIHRATGDLLPDLIATLQGDERNVLLTLARMWRTLSTAEFVSKAVAASWAAVRLPVEQAATLIDAREAYLGLGKAEDWCNRGQEVQRTVGMLRDCVRANLATMAL